MARLIVDAMGSDRGPQVVLEGISQALPELLRAKDELVIVGDPALLRPLLKKRRFRELSKALESTSTSSFSVRIESATQTIEMEDSIRAIRAKPNASINVGCELAAQSYLQARKDPEAKPFAFISPGHSGAIMASALLKMGRLPQIERPAIAVKLPTLQPSGCTLLDIGANVDCKPEHLRDFAIMGALYAQVEPSPHQKPRVAILANGEEAKKGNELTRATAELIQKHPAFQTRDAHNPLPGEAVATYIGYAEGKEIFKGEVDVIVADGFVGNVVLKALEGLSEAVISVIKTEARRNPLASLGFLLSAGVLRRFKKKFDYAEYGAAPLLGVAGYVFICHGRSNSKAIKNAILRARTAVNYGMVERLEKALEAQPPQKAS